jgi:hypothetical protein
MVLTDQVANARQIAIGGSAATTLGGGNTVTVDTGSIITAITKGNGIIKFTFLVGPAGTSLHFELTCPGTWDDNKVVSILAAIAKSLNEDDLFVPEKQFKENGYPGCH